MIFLDTNIVVPFLSTEHPRHERVQRFIFKQADNEVPLVISPQIVGETFRVLTSPKAVIKPFSPADLLHIGMGLLEESPLQIVSPGKQSIEVALFAAAKHGISSARIFDLLIYGTMREHGITRIATFNEKDFRNLEGIELALIPE